MSPIIAWQLALVHALAQPEFVDVTVTYWRLDADNSPRFDLAVAGIQLMLYQVASSGPLRYFLAPRDQPEGTYGDGPVVTLPADPHGALCQLFRAARQYAQTRCHAGAGHLPGRDRGAAGVLCWPCYVDLSKLYKRSWGASAVDVEQATEHDASGR